MEIFLLPWHPHPDLILPQLWFFSSDPWLLQQLLFILHMLPVLASTICRLPFCVWLCSGALVHPFLPDFHCVGMYHCWAWRRWSLKINQVIWAPFLFQGFILWCSIRYTACRVYLESKESDTDSQLNAECMRGSSMVLEVFPALTHWGLLAQTWGCSHFPIENSGKEGEDCIPCFRKQGEIASIKWNFERDSTSGLLESILLRWCHGRIFLLNDLFLCSHSSSNM